MTAASDALSCELIRVDQPLFLISQAQRSGGTLLLRLLDGHPECHVAPFQLRGVDQAAKRPPQTPEEAWALLHDPKLVERYHTGFRQRKRDVLSDEETHPFELAPELQREIYDTCTRDVREPTPRALFDCYFTSYFSAWLDYANREPQTKRWLVGFEPGVSRSLGRRRALERVYPDGRVISIVRDPWSWYASARRWEPQWRDRELAVEHWWRVAMGTVKWRGERRRGEGEKRERAVRVITFDDLLTQTERTMRGIAAWLGIEFRPELLRPTFNGRPIRANTSFSDVATGVSSRPLERAREELGPDDVAYIEERCGALYRRLAHKAERDWSGR
jgi:hypothetical protein